MTKPSSLSLSAPVRKRQSCKNINSSQCVTSAIFCINYLMKAFKEGRNLLSQFPRGGFPEEGTFEMRRYISISISI